MKAAEAKLGNIRNAPDCFPVLGVNIAAVQVPDVIRCLEEWIAEGRTHFVCVTNVHVVMEAQKDAEFRRLLNAADMCVPDGMPLIWVARQRGLRLSRRVAGPDLFLEFLRATAEKGYSHFFYGGAEGIPEKLVQELRREFPGLRVAGAYSPPFRRLTEQEDAAVVEMINRAAPDVLWVGLGCPKQERWMFEHRDRLKVPVMLGVGQVFDIYAGTLRRAPRWMCEWGLEWFFRLMSEPRRLWRRYLVYNTQFVLSLFREGLRLAK
ncbi:MAG: WecB/TagA/CpsF family glycosyltransferase [Terriglobales bacterium]